MCFDYQNWIINLALATSLIQTCFSVSKSNLTIGRAILSAFSLPKLQSCLLSTLSHSFRWHFHIIYARGKICLDLIYWWFWFMTPRGSKIGNPSAKRFHSRRGLMLGCNLKGSCVLLDSDVNNPSPIFYLLWNWKSWTTRSGNNSRRCLQRPYSSTAGRELDSEHQRVADRVETMSSSNWGYHRSFGTSRKAA